MPTQTGHLFRIASHAKTFTATLVSADSNRAASGFLYDDVP